MKKVIVTLMILFVAFGLMAEGWTIGWSAGSSAFQELDKNATVKSGKELPKTNDKIGVAVEVFGDYRLADAVSLTPSVRVEVPVKNATEETEVAHYISAGAGASYIKVLEKGIIRTTVTPEAVFNVKTLKFGVGVRGTVGSDVAINDRWSIYYSGTIGFIRIDDKNWCNYGINAGATVKL